MYQLNPTEPSNPKGVNLPISASLQEKMIRTGPKELQDRDLLTLVLASNHHLRVEPALVERVGSFMFGHPVYDALPPVDELACLKGVGVSRACKLLAGMELGRRSVGARGRPILTAEDAISHLSWMSELEKEHFHALFLDTRRRLITSDTISIGTLDASLVHPREVFRPAIRCGASAVIVAHNHPSGNAEPSPEDLALTHRLIKAGHLLGLSLLDHLVVGAKEVISIREHHTNLCIPWDRLAS